MAEGEQPFAIFGNVQTFEIAPVLLAAEHYYPGEARVRMGSIANLVGAPPVPGFGEEGVADVATNAETQLLRYSVDNPNLRVVMTVTEGLYRVVARRSAGIESVADLAGKRIATIPQTSAGYFLRLMLEREGLTYNDIEAVPIVPLVGMTEALANGEVDAVVIWEPESENAAQVLGDDIVTFSGHGVYRELFNLNTTTEALADPVRRAEIVRFVRAIIDASSEVRRDPSRAQAMIVESGSFDPQDVLDSWEHHGWTAAIPDDLLDVLEKQEQWLAARDERTPRSRAEIATLIDTSVYEEALALPDPATRSAQVLDLRSVREIKHLQHLWGYLATQGDWDSMEDLLTPDAVMQFQHGEFVGADEIADDLHETQGGGDRRLRPDRLNLRLWLSPVVTLDQSGNSATGRWHEVAMTADEGKSADWAGGTWVIKYDRTSEGWRIAHMRYYHQFDGPYAEGWAHVAEELERAPYHYTPDEAGVVLPDRRSEVPLSAPLLARNANLLHEASLAQNVVAAFGYYLDRGMYDDIADLFTEDGEAGVISQGAWRGREGIMRFLARFGAPGLDTGELNDRPQLMPLVEIDEATGRTAKVTTMEVGMSGQHGGEGQWSAALMEFWLALGDDGKWRIARLWREPLMRAEYEAGWSEPLPATIPATGATPPDLMAVVPAESGYPESLLTARFSSELGFSSGEERPLLRLDPLALEKAEAFDGAENVSNAYGYYIDQFAWRNTAAVFAREGWKELSYIGTFIGRERVLGSLIQRYGEGGPNDAFQAIHQKTQPFVTVLDDGTRAMVRTRLWQFNSGTEPGGSWIGGIYENQVVKEDGIWRIHGMDLDYVWLGDYATGWTGIDPAASSRFGPSEEAIAEFGPDAPLRGETFAPFPRIAPMGFHFANPVSGREPEVRLHWSDGNREVVSD